MTFSIDPETGEILSDDTGADTPPLELENSGKDPDTPEGDDVFDTLLWARDAAEVVGEILGRKVSTGEFRRMVFQGKAPHPAEGTDQWLHSELEAAFKNAQNKTVQGPGLDFELLAREAAELVGDRLGTRLSATGFRQMVLDGEAPPPIAGTDKWSQKAVSAWLDHSEAEAEDEDSQNESDEEGEEENQPVHRDVYDFWERTFAPYYELHDVSPNPLTQNRPQVTWCRKWWLHRGVVGRINAAWFAWEVAYAEGGAAISAWILEHSDRHFDRIMAEEGPLRLCKSNHSDALDIYPTDPAPAALRTTNSNGGQNDG